MTLSEFLRSEQTAGGTRFELDRRLNGAFDGVFGGVVAAAALQAGRRVAQGRLVAAIDCQFHRSLPAGPAVATSEEVRSGRSLTFVRVAMRAFAEERPAASAQIAFVAPEALHDLSVAQPDPADTISMERGRRLAPVAPIVETLQPRWIQHEDGSIATTVAIPWSDPGTGPEAACLAGDMAVGPPVGLLLARHALRIPTPNPDLSLRFLAQEAAPSLTGDARLERVDRGLAATTVRLASGAGLVAVGSSTTLLLAGGPGEAGPGITQSLAGLGGDTEVGPN